MLLITFPYINIFNLYKLPSCSFLYHSAPMYMYMIMVLAVHQQRHWLKSMYKCINCYYLKYRNNVSSIDFFFPDCSWPLVPQKANIIFNSLSYKMSFEFNKIFIYFKYYFRESKFNGLSRSIRFWRRLVRHQMSNPRQCTCMNTTFKFWHRKQ